MCRFQLSLGLVKKVTSKPAKKGIIDNSLDTGYVKY
jgi:hypothetical protein